MATIGLDIRSKIENSSIEERIEMIEDMYNKWVLKSPPKKNDIFECLKISIKNFGLDSSNFQLGSFEKAVLYAMSEISYLRLYTLELEDDLGDREDDRKDIIFKINSISKIIVCADNAIRYNFKLLNSVIEDDIMGDSSNKDLFDFTPIDTSKTTAYQNLLLYLLENLARRGFKRYYENCYEKIYTPDGYDTHCWKQVMSIKEFIYYSCQKNTNFEMWQNLTKSSDSNVINYLSNHVGVDFENVEKDRHIFSFNDGIYITCKIVDGKYVDEWIPYGSKKICGDVTSCNYINLNFEESTRPIKDHTTYRYNDWWNIIEDKCPLFKSIMDYQEWDKEVQSWLCIMMGRCLYDTNELDGWQVASFLLGQAGSGKSTIIVYILKRFYEACDVGTISNNIEKGFGLSALYEKLLNVGPEIKENFKMEQAEFQSIISGETVQINIKGHTAKSVDWKSPVMFAGNVVPNYNDNSGSVTRRLLTFLFNKKVRKGDTQLGNKLEKEIGYILQACNRAYLEAVNQNGSEDIWNIVPEYFRNSRDEMAETTNALTSFLKSDKVKFGKDECVKENVFVEVFNEHCKEMNIPKQRWNSQFCMGPFSNFDITIDKHGRKDDITGTFFIGVSVKEGVKITYVEEEDK